MDGSGRILDVGCGPGVLTVELAPKFGEAVALDPDPGMLAEGRSRAEELSGTNIRWVQAVAEDIPDLEIGPCRLVTFGQSFHWTDRERVAEIVYDLLEPGGAIALIVHTVEGRPVPPSTGHPPIPHDEIKDLIARYLSGKKRPPEGKRVAPDRYEDALARTRFGVPRIVFAPGRPDIVRSTDSVVAGSSRCRLLPRTFSGPTVINSKWICGLCFEIDHRMAISGTGRATLRS
jgi:SAM-dependent methyltransferase